MYLSLHLYIKIPFPTKHNVLGRTLIYSIRATTQYKLHIYMPMSWHILPAHVAAGIISVATASQKCQHHLTLFKMHIPLRHLPQLYSHLPLPVFPTPAPPDRIPRNPHPLPHAQLKRLLHRAIII